MIAIKTIVLTGSIVENPALSIEPQHMSRRLTTDDTWWSGRYQRKQALLSP